MNADSYQYSIHGNKFMQEVKRAPQGLRRLCNSSLSRSNKAPFEVVKGDGQKVGCCVFIKALPGKLVWNKCFGTLMYFWINQQIFFTNFVLFQQVIYSNCLCRTKNIRIKKILCEIDFMRKPLNKIKKKHFTLFCLTDFFHSCHAYVCIRIQKRKHLFDLFNTCHTIIMLNYRNKHTCR